MNYLAIVQRIMREAGRTDGEPDSIANAVSDARLAADWAADAARNLDLEAHNWRWLIKRVAGKKVVRPNRRDILSRGLPATFDCTDAKRDLGCQPEAGPARSHCRALTAHGTAT